MLGTAAAFAEAEGVSVAARDGSIEGVTVGDAAAGPVTEGDGTPNGSFADGVGEDSAVIGDGDGGVLMLTVAAASAETDGFDAETSHPRTPGAFPPYQNAKTRTQTASTGIMIFHLCFLKKFFILLTPF
jgi:hypothetical protein